MRKPRPLQPGDQIAIVAPASSVAQEQLQAGAEELRSLGFVPVYDERSLFERGPYTAGSSAVRAAALRDAWLNPDIAAIVAARGGYGSVHLLPLLDAHEFSTIVKPFIAYSDNTSILSWLTLTCGMVTFHGPMIDRRLARGPAGYDRDTFLRCLTRPAPVGVITSPGIEVLRHGEANGMLIGGTMTQLAASLGTPFAFDPPQGCVLFLDEVAERPYRIDRLLTQLKLAGILDRAGALVFNELPRCDEPGGSLAARDVVVELTEDFNGPVLFGLPSGHSDGATLTIPFGLRARIDTRSRPGLIIDESAVQT
ncbi:MAG TPA: LD-carboxypeptidase [Vicinamibacterales bacterium]|nr:LD-carboxypeptidase [Vicinamibacterales bacterium]